MRPTNYIPDISLTPHFNLNEFILSDYIEEKNDEKLRSQQCTISAYTIINLFRLCYHVLEPARVRLRIPIIINSGYRCPQLNTAIGGVSNSQHVLGMAADIKCNNNRALFEEICVNLDYDQLICYGDPKSPRFIHVSFKSFKENRKQVIYKP